MADASIDVYDHLRWFDTDAVDPADTSRGIYRVVGTTEDTVTLLRVADADGRRRHTGECVTVDRDDLAAFAPADNPDGNRSLSTVVGGLVDGIGWQLRVFSRSLAARPIPSAIALAVLVVGLGGDQAGFEPEWAFTVAVFAGSLTLAAIGSRVV